jgi:lipopolysaccharide transport system ATP-binding protein
MPVAIKAENISKMYRLGEIGTGTISRDIERWIARIRGREDPFLKVGEANDRTTKGSSDVVWSLKDINFEIEQGDAVGIIGRNGAGKSTLLKILSRITAPTTGKVRGNGRIASLLEVGTGFNPELTGRENIFLNGAILGMRKAEIRAHFDAIVDFAGVERYIDTPVKRYSTGMYVRLAFAVAAYLESEILIVDEVLSVGDAEFQMKCLGKMKDVSMRQGRTVLFVSHNMDAVINLCKNGIVLDNGRSMFSGTALQSVEFYQQYCHAALSNHWVSTRKKSIPRFKEFRLQVKGEQPDLILLVSFTTWSDNTYPSAFVAFGIKNSLGSTIMEAIPTLRPFVKFDGNENFYECEIRISGFIPNTYSMYAWLGPSEAENYDWIDDVMTFEITQPPMKDRTFPYHHRSGFIVANSKLVDKL